MQSAAFLALGIIGFVPVVGFILARPLLRPSVWLAWLAFLVIWALVDRSFYAAWFMQAPLDHELVGLVAALPALVATYCYTRPSSGAWTRQG